MIRTERAGERRLDGTHIVRCFDAMAYLPVFSESEPNCRRNCIGSETVRRKER